MMDLTLTKVWVPGSPKTKGSLTVKNSGRRGGQVYVEEAPGSVAWRMFIVERVRADMAQRGQTEPYPGPVCLSAVFHQQIRAEDWVRKVAGSGDVDKLLRNLFDALSVNVDNPAKGAGLIVDDMQIVSLHEVGKVPDLVNPGLALHVWRLPHDGVDTT